MIREKTFGIIIFKKEGKGIRYLLLHHGGEYWNFPKGHQEAGENEIESALRELREETGITEIKIIDGLGEKIQSSSDLVEKQMENKKYLKIN